MNTKELEIKQTTHRRWIITNQNGKKQYKTGKKEDSLKMVFNTLTGKKYEKT
jgi:hypothetical protein